MGRLDSCFKYVKDYYVEDGAEFFRIVPKKRTKIMGLNYMGVSFSPTSGKTFSWQELYKTSEMVESQLLKSFKQRLEIL